ncbi:hypothetical protein T459_15842 [Capsicum annuum]|uniref:Uncharacterized protein n=1 Tax=Capsicum annuum TaxID=4072 RepID=A0A2G2Z702_CAPAN|nr:putative adenylate isopentenyltransferase 5, chloroplastic-like [Capsicum annuum]PHT77790.1 hypothetical protein T459_15842 [Capsicum annuum]
MSTSVNSIIKLNKNKILFIMGDTGMRKSRLSVDRATHFSAQIINFDKMHVYKGLGIVTNKIIDSEKQSITHYWLGKYLFALSIYTKQLFK